MFITWSIKTCNSGNIFIHSGNIFIRDRVANFYTWSIKTCNSDHILQLRPHFNTWSSSKFLYVIDKNLQLGPYFLYMIELQILIRFYQSCLLILVLYLIMQVNLNECVCFNYCGVWCWLDEEHKKEMKKTLTLS